MYHCDNLSPLDLSESDRAAWIGLLEAYGPPSPLLHPDFACAVGRARSDARVTLVRGPSGLAAAFAHHRRPDGFARPLGAAFSDIHAILARPEFGWSLPRLLGEAGLKSARFTALHARAPALSGRASQEVSLAAVLDGDPAGFLEARRREHPRKFKSFRRLLRKLESEIGPISLEASTDGADLDRLFAWKRDQYRRNARHDVLSAPWAGRLMQEIFRGAGDVTGLLLVLKVNGRMIAGEFGPRWKGVFHPWIAAYDPDWSKWSPGHLLVHALIAAAPALSLTRYELGSGREDYKKYFANHETPLHAGYAHAQCLSGRMRALGHRTWDGAAKACGARVERLAWKVSGRIDHVAAAEPALQRRLVGLAQSAGALWPASAQHG